MQRENRTGQNRKFATAAVTLDRQGEGLLVAILSLSGLALSLGMLSHGIVANALQLMVAQ